MKNSTSRDIYQLSSSLIKSVISFVVYPLTTCINHCIEDAVFPYCLKHAKTVPIYKSGSLDNPANFRPISVVPIFGKIFETVITRSLGKYFEEKGLFSSSQFGFRTGRSTTDAVNKIVTNVLNSFEKKGFAGVTMCDLSKAFDIVDHSILLSKLSYYGVGGSVNRLLMSYLTDRKQTVSVDGCFSHARDIEYGVPQGSVLGPLLFIIMVNDISLYMENQIVSYADDTSLFSSNVDLELLRTQMSNAYENVSAWFQANYLSLNEAKTQTMISNLRNVTNEIETVKLLGIMLDSKLTWTSHIDWVCGRLSRVVFLLRRLKNLVPHQYLKISYFGFFQSVMMYGLILWGGAANVGRILLLQKKVLRIMTGSDYYAHCRPLFKSQHIMTVFSLYVMLLLIKVKNELHTLKCRSEMHRHDTRQSNYLDVPYVRLRKLQCQSDVLSIRAFNRLPLCSRNLSISVFKTKVKRMLLENPLYSVGEFFDLPCDVINNFFQAD